MLELADEVIVMQVRQKDINSEDMPPENYPNAIDPNQFTTAALTLNIPLILDANVNKGDLVKLHTLQENLALKISFTKRLINSYIQQIIIPRRPNCCQI